MNITEVRIAGDELILKTTDFAEARRWAYNFKPGDYEIDRRRKKRSNDANALCWKLCTEIANVLRSDKDSIYIEMLKRYGQNDYCYRSHRYEKLGRTGREETLCDRGSSGRG